MYREENRSIEPVDLGPKSGFRFAGWLPRHRLRLMRIVDRLSFRRDYGFQKKRTILCFYVLHSVRFRTMFEGFLAKLESMISDR